MSVHFLQIRAEELAAEALDLQRECKGLEKERDALKEALQAIADRIPPHSVYQALRWFVQRSFEENCCPDQESTEGKITDQITGAISWQELNEGLQWLADHNPQEEGHVK